LDAAAQDNFQALAEAYHKDGMLDAVCRTLIQRVLQTYRLYREAVLEHMKLLHELTGTDWQTNNKYWVSSIFTDRRLVDGWGGVKWPS
jgi:hypothetical protein